LLTFVHQYGLLGLPDSLDERYPIEENAEAWFDETLAMQKVVSALDALSGFVDESWLEKYGIVTGSARARREAYAQMIEGEINRARERHRLLPALAFHRVESEIEFYDTFQPRSLIAAIWMQAINAVLRRSDHVPCRRKCGNWIPQSNAKRGPKPQFCSDKCRALYDQQQVAHARTLARQRTNITAIMTATGLTRERVRGIVTTEKQKGRR
jgi:hypothetical protein